MARSERNGADQTSTEARARSAKPPSGSRYGLRWLSIVAIPALAYLSAAPVHSPWFEMLVVGPGIYNFALSHALARGRSGPGVDPRHGRTDSVFLFLMLQAERGVLNASLHLRLSGDGERVCMRLPIAPSLGIRTLYAGELAVPRLHRTDRFPRRRSYGQNRVRFSHGGFRLPLVREARNRLRRCSRVTRRSALLLHRLLRTARRNATHRRRAPRSRRRCPVLVAARTRRLRDSCGLATLRPRPKSSRLIRVTEETVHDLRTLLCGPAPALARRPRSRRGVTQSCSRANVRSMGIPVSLRCKPTRCPIRNARWPCCVAQEAFTNIRRHSQSRFRQVRLFATTAAGASPSRTTGEGSREAVRASA